MVKAILLIDKSDITQTITSKSNCINHTSCILLLIKYKLSFHILTLTVISSHPVENAAQLHTAHANPYPILLIVDADNSKRETENSTNADPC